jgi:hypothetical protein
MITELPDIPENIAGFKATGEITKEDYQNVVIPKIDKVVRDYGEINFLFLIDTELKEFTAGAWLQDSLIGIKHLTKWRRAAIVTDNEGAIKFTDAFSVVAPGEFKGFRKADYETALNWVSQK